jgi:hypothetical protein
MSKTLTKECKNCGLMTVGENNEFFCGWGKNKRMKVLKENRRAVKIRTQCTLKR